MGLLQVWGNAGPIPKHWGTVKKKSGNFKPYLKPAKLIKVVGWVLVTVFHVAYWVIKEKH